jgi:hypothetical protein
MNAEKLIKETVERIKSGQLTDFSPLIALFQFERKPMTLDGHFMFLPFFSLERPKYLTLQCGRQVSKSYNTAEVLFLTTGMVESFNTIYIAPRYDQLKRFHNQVLSPLIKTSPATPYLLDKSGSDSIEMKTFLNGNTLMLEHAFTSGDRVRGASGCGAVTCDESQDINPDFLPIFESTTDASRYGCIQCSGTPKTSDTLLTLQFNKSSQCHWAIKCPHCSKWNIADIDEQLIGMIGKTGLSCAFCGKILDPRTGGWLPKFPERQRFHAGYHIPQIILPMHCENETKWAVLRSRQAEWTKTRMFNEVLGVPNDDSVKLLTVNDLEKAQTPWENNLDTAARLAKEFTTVFVGVDWSGGGGGFSRTAIAVLGRKAGQRDTCILFLETLPHGLTPEEEADRVAAVYAKVHAQMLAHDYTGAGFVRESVLLGRHPYLREHIYPFAYVFRTGKQLVTYQESGSRKSANVDKTRSLLLTFNSIRSGLLRVPKFNPANSKEPILEMLNIVERPQEFSKATIKDVYILQRAAGRYDDAAHAVNIAYIAQCDLTEDWPSFSMDPKYEMSESALEALTGGSGEVLVS